PQVAGSSAEHVLTARAGETQHDVLGAAGDHADAFQRASTEALLRHPYAHRAQVVHPGEATVRLVEPALSATATGCRWCETRSSESPCPARSTGPPRR